MNNCLKPVLGLLLLRGLHNCCSLKWNCCVFLWGLLRASGVSHWACNRAGLWTEWRTDALYCWKKKVKTCSTANHFFPPSFLKFLHFFSFVLMFTFSWSWLPAATQLTDGWFHLATWGSLSPSKFLSQAVSRARLLISAVPLPRHEAENRPCKSLCIIFPASVCADGVPDGWGTHPLACQHLKGSVATCSVKHRLANKVWFAEITLYGGYSKIMTSYILLPASVL